MMALYIYITIFVICFAFIVFIFNPLDYALSTSNQEFEDILNDTDDDVADYSQTTKDDIRNIWKYYPVVIFVMIGLGAIVLVQKEERYGV